MFLLGLILLICSGGEGGMAIIGGTLMIVSLFTD